MRIAVSKATLSLPPTYFVVQHALALHDEHAFRFFAAAADVSDASVARQLELEDASLAVPVLARSAPAQRMRFAPLLGGAVSRAIRDWSPAIVHQHFANLSGGAVDAAQRLGVPLLLTVHGADVYVPLIDPSSRPLLARPLLRHHRKVVMAAFRSAERILAVSHFLADRAVEAGADPAKIVVHYQGIDTDAYRPGSRWEGPPRIVAVGALSESKGTRDLLRASISLAPHVPHRLVIIGTGPLLGVAEQAAAEHPHILVRGQLDRDGVRAELGTAAVLALPTRHHAGRREAAGLVLLEAQASGVPVVAYDSGGAREMLADGATGLLVAEGDLAALTEAIGSIVQMSDAERLGMGRLARDWVVEHRSLARSVQELDAHYRELVAGS